MTVPRVAAIRAIPAPDGRAMNQNRIAAIAQLAAARHHETVVAVDRMICPTLLGIGRKGAKVQCVSV
jgi:hypothetical protein